MKLNRLFCFPVLLVFLNACGFHLQSKPELPAEMQRVMLEVQDPYSQFARRLETHFEQNGVNVVTTPEGAACSKCPSMTTRKEIQSIGDNARVREFLIRHTVQFRLLASDGTEMVPLQTLNKAGSTALTSRISCCRTGRRVFENDLADSLARMVVRRLGTYGK